MNRNAFHIHESCGGPYTCTNNTTCSWSCLVCEIYWPQTFNITLGNQPTYKYFHVFGTWTGVSIDHKETVYFGLVFAVWDAVKYNLPCLTCESKIILLASILKSILQSCFLLFCLNFYGERAQLSNLSKHVPQINKITRSVINVTYKERHIKLKRTSQQHWAAR